MVNPFGGPVLRFASVDSTQSTARTCAAKGAVSGTVIQADFQGAGRGRGEARKWAAPPNESLLFTALFRYAGLDAVPPLFTLRAGLGVSRALADYCPCLADKISVKWPNDVLVNGKKCAGLLVESDVLSASDCVLYLGVGVNVFETDFDGLPNATSLAREARVSLPDRSILLSHILRRLYNALALNPGEVLRDLRKRLFRCGETVEFVPGGADTGAAPVTGKLVGIGAVGELLLLPEGADKPLRFFTGELRGVYRPSRGCRALSQDADAAL
jgi:BirA family biotin operon repressor/biotin-[acetyl-CoA-carboxylase] ligase